MIDALKKMDKKFLIIAGLIICLPIIIIMFLAIIQGCGNRKVSPEKYEEKMISALEKYIEDADKTPKKEGEILTVKLSTLVDKEYIKSTEDLLDDSTCKGSVSVRRNGASVESTKGGYLNYTVNLECKEYKTTHLVDKLKENIVTEESGLYQDGEVYIFKGNKVKNYINFFGYVYRIVSIDKDGVLKLVKSESEGTGRIWDNKYNTETNSSSGKNIYKDSVILESLLDDYANDRKIDSSARKHIVAYNSCIGKRSNINYSIDSSLDCSENLENQVISLLNVSDYAKASLDSECKDLNSYSCDNYNYLSGVADSTWTLNTSSDNTYEVIYLSNGIMDVQNANVRDYYNIVIYIDGNELYTSGDGSEKNPYVIE